jgi:hypothetical protein
MDFAGELIIPDLEPGLYRLQILEKGHRFTIATRKVQITAGATTTRADIYLRLPGEIKAVVVNDSSREPVQGSTVLLVSSEYVSGHAVYTYAQQGTTDDRGQVNFSERVEAGHPYFLLALPPGATRPTLSGTPSMEAIWYPGRPAVLQPFTLGSGERKSVDLVMRTAGTHCLDGKLTADGLPAELDFEVAIPEVAGYVGFSGGTRGVISKGRSDASGHFQVCGVWPGEFVLAAGLNKDFYGRSTISVADKDVRNISLNARSPLSLTVDIRWDRVQLQEETFRLQVSAFSRASFNTGFDVSTNVVVPSQITVSLLPFTDYRIGGGFPPPGSVPDSYLKEVNCSGTITRNILSLGESPCDLHLTFGTDMGRLAATVIDKDNNPDSNSSVCVFPNSAATREQIAETGTCSAVEGPGTGSVSIPVRPGRYLAMVMPPGTFDWVEYILAHRGQGELIEIAARSTAKLTLKSSKEIR